MPANLTYATLVTDIQTYTERPTDTQLLAQIPRLIMLAENRIAAATKGLGFKTIVQSVMISGAVGAIIAKPTYWRENQSFNYTNSTGQRVQVLPRTYEYCRNFWPQSSLTAPPRFYSDYNYTNFFIVPSPDQAYPFELSYYARLTPIDPTNSTSWLTDNAPQVLFRACMIEANAFLKNWDKVEFWTERFNEAMADINREDTRKPQDANVTDANKA
jgi:hypothetical protein